MARKQFILLDSSSAPDDNPSPDDVELYKTEFSSLKPASNSWLISHRPIWGVKAHDRFLNETLYQALPAPARVLPKEIELVLSGHMKGYGRPVETPTTFPIEIVRWPAQGWRPIDDNSGDQGASPYAA